MKSQTKHTIFRSGETGVSILEVMVALAVLALFTATTFFTFTTLNAQAMANRLYTGAVAVAQTQLDVIQNLNNGQMIGSGTALGGTMTWPSTIGSSATTSETVVLYSDPQVFVNGTSTLQVPGTLTTTVLMTGTIMVSSTYWNYYAMSVNVSYNYRNNPYSITFQTLRSNAP